MVVWFWLHVEEDVSDQIQCREARTKDIRWFVFIMLRPLALLVSCCTMASTQHLSLVRDAAPFAAAALARTRHLSLV